MFPTGVKREPPKTHWFGKFRKMVLLVRSVPIKTKSFVQAEALQSLSEVKEKGSYEDWKLNLGRKDVFERVSLRRSKKGKDSFLN